MKNGNKSKYGKCECGGAIVERRLTVRRRYHGQLFEFENVPVGVCHECGQRIYEGRVLHELERIAQDKSNIRKFIKVPVVEYKAA